MNPASAVAHEPALAVPLADEVVTLRIAALLDADSPRAGGIDPEHVRVLRDAEIVLPPIVVHGTTMRVIDGMHRLAAARAAGRAEIEARLFRGSAADAFLLSVQANVAHGLPLSAADRRAAAERVIASHPTLSDRSIARSTGLAARTVAALRAGLADAAGTGGKPPGADVRMGRDGRARPLSATTGRLAASEAISRRPGASLREIAREAGISVGTARDVRLRLLAGEDPLPSGRPRLAERPRQDDRADPAAILENLRRDPRLRYSDSGRALLRWLDARLVTPDQRPDASVAIPPHCQSTVAKFARECARVWSELADEIETPERTAQES